MSPRAVASGSVKCRGCLHFRFGEIKPSNIRRPDTPMTNHPVRSDSETNELFAHGVIRSDILRTRLDQSEVRSENIQLHDAERRTATVTHDR
jgi:hypothetical protein